VLVPPNLTGVVRVTRTRGVFETLYLQSIIIIVYYVFDVAAHIDRAGENYHCRYYGVYNIRTIMLWIVISWPGNTDDDDYYYCHYGGVREVVRTFPNPFYVITTVNSRCHYHYRKKISSSDWGDDCYGMSPLPLTRWWFVASRQHISARILPTIKLAYTIILSSRPISLNHSDFLFLKIDS